MKHMPSATLILSQTLFLAGGAIVQIRVWRLRHIDRERPHGLKYSLFYGRPGERIIACDNEAEKGDHRHYRDSEEAYRFDSLSKLVGDFMADVKQEMARDRS